MLKKYFYTILIFACLSATNVVAQESKSASKPTETGIEGLTFFPNPVTNGKIYISSKANDEKIVTIFDVLGKKVFQSSLNSRELNISTLSSGVYIIKFETENTSTTRKLIVR